jgi:hypothetical protein
LYRHESCNFAGVRARAALLMAAFSATAFAADPPHEEEFTALDLNADGRVSLAEAAGHAAVVVRFDRADRNRDGKLTMAEFNRLKKLKIRVDRKAAARNAERNAGVGASGR